METAAAYSQSCREARLLAAPPAASGRVDPRGRPFASATERLAAIITYFAYDKIVRIVYCTV